jgi:hypothetical protein
VHAVTPKIGSKRLGYLDLEGNPTFFMCPLPIRLINITIGVEQEDHIAGLGWNFGSSAGVVEVPPIPDKRMFRHVTPNRLTPGNRNNKSHLHMQFRQCNFL